MRKGNLSGTIGSVLLKVLRGNSDFLLNWLETSSWKKVYLCASAIVIGCGIYGFSIGVWRSPLMGVYVGVKFPLLIFVTLFFNGILNGVLGLLLGSGLGFKQSLLAQLTSFTVFALLNAALSPITLFFASSLPNITSESAQVTHASYLLVHTAVIAYTGFIANLHLYRYLQVYAPSKNIALRTFGAWVVGNCFVGAQFSWILRPFFGRPNLAVEFMRPDPMDGTFYEAVWRSLETLFGSSTPGFFITTATATIGALTILFTIKQK